MAANYAGASADVMEQSVAIPIEQAVNGAENMLCMSSRSTNTGSYSLTCTFAVGIDVNVAAMDVQNRVQQAQGNLPSEVLRTGITVRKRSPSLLMLVSLYSPDAWYDQLFLTNYAQIYVRDPLSRVAGVGDIQALGPEYEVLDSERNVYSAELTLARARLDELLSFVQLYSPRRRLAVVRSPFSIRERRTA